MSKPDLSARVFLVHVLGLFVVAILTAPPQLRADLPFLFTRIVGVLVLAAIVSFLFYVLRRQRERSSIRRNLVMTSWVMLALIVLGERT